MEFILSGELNTITTSTFCIRMVHDISWCCSLCFINSTYRFQSKSFYLFCFKPLLIICQLISNRAWFGCSTSLSGSNFWWCGYWGCLLWRNIQKWKEYFFDENSFMYSDGKFVSVCINKHREKDAQVGICLSLWCQELGFKCLQKI